MVLLSLRKTYALRGGRAGGGEQQQGRGQGLARAQPPGDTGDETSRGQSLPAERRRPLQAGGAESRRGDGAGVGLAEGGRPGQVFRSLLISTNNPHRPRWRGRGEECPPPPPPPPFLHPPSIIAHPPLPRHGPDYLPRGNPLVHWRAAPSDVQNTQDPRRPDIRRFYLTNYLNKLHQDGAPLPPETPEPPPLEPAENGPIGPHGLPVRKYPAALFHSENKKTKSMGAVPTCNHKLAFESQCLPQNGGRSSTILTQRNSTTNTYFLVFKIC